MSDVVVTVPKDFTHADAPGKRGLAAWIGEGDAAGDDLFCFTEWEFFLGGHPPDIVEGDRVYVVCEGKLRGYAPLIRVERYLKGYALVRGCGQTAVAVTLRDQSGRPLAITGFRGFRYRWWKRDEESPFPEWEIP